MTPVYRWAAGLCLALAPALACAADLKVKPSLPAKPSLDDKPTCGNHGTSIDFVDTPREASAQAKKEKKLVFVLHVSGHFEDPRFT
jgi:hypothetical protein